ncbi:unnamed protein product, partial [Eretmochelys imbricata]
MSFYKMPTDVKKPKLLLVGPACVQKRRPAYTHFAEETVPMLNPAFQPEIEPQNQEDFMGSCSVVKEEKDSIGKKLFPTLEEADSKVKGMEEESVYEDMVAEGLSEDCDVEIQPIDPDSWKDGDIVMTSSEA